VTVRPAVESDGPALVAVDVATWSTVVTPGPQPDGEGPFFSERTPPEAVLVCEVDGEVAGYVVLRQEFPMPSHAHVLEIGGLAVGPGAQGRGAGRLLVEAAVEEARRRGAVKLSLRVLGGNDGARRLYERCGFVVEGVLAGEFVLDGAEVDDVLMARRLD